MLEVYFKQFLFCLFMRRCSVSRFKGGQGKPVAAAAATAAVKNTVALFIQLHNMQRYKCIYI
jgi:hypothetical protein